MSPSRKNIPSPEQWVSLYGDYLYRYALSRLRDPDAAQDCVQDTLLAGIKNLEKFDGRQDIKFWLRAVMRNKIIDIFRKRARHQTVDLGEDEQILESALYKYSGIATMSPETWKFDPRQLTDHAEFREIFQTCLDELKDPMREAFILKMLENMETAEVCKVLDIDANYLWVLLHRARQELMKKLDKAWKNPPE